MPQEYPRHTHRTQASKRSCRLWTRLFPLPLLFFAGTVFGNQSSGKDTAEICFEAELANTLRYPWHITDAAGASQGKAVYIPESAGGAEAFPEGHPVAVYHLDLPKNRTWRAWVRVKWNGECSNSLFFRLGEANKYGVINKNYGEWQWVSAGTWEPAKAACKAVISAREDGIKLDQIFLTTRGKEVDPQARMEPTTVPVPPEEKQQVKLFMASGAPRLPPPDFIFSHRPGKPTPLRSIQRLILKPGRESELTCWLRNNPADQRTVGLRLRTSAPLKITPDAEREITFAPNELLKKVKFKLKSKRNMPRTVKRLGVILRHPDGRIEAGRALVEKPFQWLVTNALPCGEQSTIATPAPVENKLDNGFPGNNDKVNWQTAPPDTINRFGLLNMRKAVTDRNYVMAYAYTRVHSPRKRKYLLEVRHDDMIRIWVNGEKVFTSTQSTPSYISRKLIQVPFRKGTNHILVKLNQKKNYWEFCTRVLDMSGRPAPVHGLSTAHLTKEDNADR